MNTDGIRVWEVIGELQHHVSNAGMTVNGAKTWQNQTQFGWSQSAVLRVELRMKYCSLSTLSKIRDISGEDIEHVLCYFIICSNHPLITECQKITFQAFLSKYGFVIDFLRGNNIYLAASLCEVTWLLPCCCRISGWRVGESYRSYGLYEPIPHLSF